MNTITPRKVVWIVHPRDFHDIEEKIPFLKLFPHFLKYYLILCIPPYKVSEFKKNGQGEGYIVGVMLLPIHFQRNKFVMTLRVKQAFKLAKKLGADKISIGGILSGVVEKNKMSKLFGVEVFDGTNLLAHTLAEKVQRVLLMQDSAKSSIGIIGATTKSGSILSKLLAPLNIKELHIFAKTEKNVLALAEECRKVGTINVITHTDFSSIGKCDISILTAYIRHEDGVSLVDDIKKNSLFISGIEPVSPFVFELEKSRPDIQLIKDIKLETPGLTYDNMSSVISDGSAFACLTEALVAEDYANYKIL